jgi:4'-phosphopantetheinyl transferase
VPDLRDGECHVWWASLSSGAAWPANLLDEQEAARRRQYLRDADRDRFTLGAVLARLVLGAHLGIAPGSVPVDRTCGRCGRPHGKPRLADGAAVDFSVSHSGDLVALAVTGGPDTSGPKTSGPKTSGRETSRIPVGIDVEQIAVLPQEPADIVLSAAERHAFGQLEAAVRPAAFFRYWVRKEAVLKATGDGLQVPMTDLTVSPPGQAARLTEWRGRPGFAARVALHDLRAPSGYAAAVAFVGGNATVKNHDAAELVSELPT